MVRGKFYGNVPVVAATIASGKASKTPAMILDTGFSGNLQIHPKLANELGLQMSGVIRTKMADGQIVEMPIAIAMVSMEGESHFMQVQVSDSLPLLGINVLAQFSYKAVVDCKNREITLEKV